MIESFLIDAVVFVEAMALICLYPLWRIFRRAGFPGHWALGVLFPVLGFWIAGGLLAFVDWPRSRTEGAA